MTVDILAAICIAVCAWSGYVSGSVYQIAQIVTLVIATVISRAMVAPVAFAILELQPDDVDSAAGRVFLWCFAIVYGLCWWAVRRLTREMRDLDMRGPADQIGGIVAGSARGALLALILAVGYMAVAYGEHDVSYEAFTETKIGEQAANNDFLERPTATLAAQLQAAQHGEVGDKEWDVYKDADDRKVDERRRRRRGR